MVELTSRKIPGYGWSPDSPDHRDRIFNLENTVSQGNTLARAVDLEPLFPPCYDQGQLGSCTGNGVAGIMEHRAMKQGSSTGTPSRLFIYYNERVLENTVSQDSGAQVRDGIKVVASLGVPPETLWPYDISQFAVKPSANAYASAVKHEALVYKRIVLGGPGAPMRTALAAGLPIVFGFSVPDYFESGWDPTSTPLPLPSMNTQIIGGHCGVVVGYDFTLGTFSVPVFKCRNSWGTSWGQNGYFYMDYRWFTVNMGLAQDLWVISKES